MPSTAVKPENAASTDYAFEPLLDYESGMQFMGEKGITTVSFVGSSSSSYPINRDTLLAILKKRVERLCQKQPWISGNLVRDKARHKNALLRYPKGEGPAQLSSRILDISDDPRLCALSSDSKVSEITRAIDASGAIVEKGWALVKDPSKGVCKVTICPLSSDPDGGLAIVFSLSHVVADGHTYYTLLQQIFSHEDAKEPMSCVRKHAAHKECMDACGIEEYRFMMKPALVANYVWQALFGKKAKLHVYRIDPQKVADEKERSKAQDGRAAAFVSTNDILTSSFGRAIKTRILFMAINWRNRVASVVDADAGNYESVLTYDPDSYDTPYQIRQSLSSGLPSKRVNGRRLPSTCETVRCSLGMITSWAFRNFSCEVILSKDEIVNDSSHGKAVQDEVVTVPLSLHLPVIPIDGGINFAVIFRDRKDSLAAYYCLKDATVDDLVKERAPLGDEIP